MIRIVIEYEPATGKLGLNAQGGDRPLTLWALVQAQQSLLQPVPPEPAIEVPNQQLARLLNGK